MEDKIFDSQFFSKLNTLKLSMNLRLTKGMGGGRKSSAKGSSVEFSDFREYMLGDDIRRIDWNAYGRLNKLYIKQFMEEKEGNFQIFVDTSESMNFGEALKSKTALQIAGALAYIIVNNLDRVYVNQIKNETQTKGVGLAGRNSFQRILKDLNQVEFNGKTSLSKAILSRPMRGEGVSIIISDFFDPDGIEDAIKYLRFKKQEIVLVQVLAKEEIDVLAEGTVNLIDVETKEHMKVTITRTVLEAYQKSLDELKDKLNRMSRKYGITYLTAISEDSIDKILFEGFKNSQFIKTRG